MAIKLPFFRPRDKGFKDTAEVTAETMPSARHSLARLGMILVLAGALVIVATGLFFQTDAARRIADSQQREIQLVAGNLTAALAELLAQRTEKMERLVRDPAIIAQAENPAGAPVQHRETELAYLFPRAVGIRILPAGLDEVDMQASPPISYAVLDMLRQAETRDTPPPAEVHLSNTPQQHINIVRRILDASGKRIVGHLMVSLPVTLLQEAMDRIHYDQGYGEVWQIGAGQPVVLAKGGQRTVRQGEPGIKVNVPGSRWEVVYWTAAGDLAAEPMGLLLVGGAATLLFALLVMLLLNWYGRLLKQDQTTVMAAVRDGQSGRLQRKYVLQLKENRTAIIAVLRLFGSSDARRVAVAAVSSAPDNPVSPPPVLAETPAPAASPSPPSMAADFGVLDDSVTEPSAADTSIDPAIFRAYDIRGVVGTTLTPDSVFLIGRAIGSEALARDEQQVLVGRDGRQSGPEMSDALIRGLRAAGVNVADIGLVPTPVLYFATHHLSIPSGVMVTGSHNPADYNGFKVMLGGEALSGAAIKGLYDRIVRQDFSQGQGEQESVEVLDDYVERIRKDVSIARPLKVAIDCGNGAASVVAQRLLETLGCQVTPLYCEVDGRFPNHHPDPTKPENLSALIETVRRENADIGIAFDGDGDRLGIIDSESNIIWPDRLLMLLAMDVLSRNPGAEIIYDVKCTSHLAKIIRDFGGSPEMWRTGHSVIKARMKETGAILAGELSGHIFFAERWYGFDDGLYSAARLIEILANDHRSSHSVFEVLPDGVNTPELTLPMAEGQAEGFMATFLSVADFPGAEITTIDGLRADFPNGWGLVRASNTTPSLVMRFEGCDAEALAEIQGLFKRALLSADPGLTLPF